jgi:peptide/nickel transport system substrate-binding protein/2-iminobutanoate/2-iminopropanoate deaminase
MSNAPADRGPIPAPKGAYSFIRFAGDFAYTAGLRPRDFWTKQVLGGTDVAAQTRATLENLKLLLDSHGLKLSQIVKTTAHLQDVAGHFQAFDAVYREFFEEPRPVRTTVGSDLNGLLVEMDFVLYCPGHTQS